MQYNDLHKISIYSSHNSKASYSCGILRAEHNRINLLGAMPWSRQLLSDPSNEMHQLNDCQVVHVGSVVGRATLGHLNLTEAIL
jgi:hypothetical protein